MLNIARALFLVVTVSIPLPTYATVKQSTSGICHPPESSHYARTRNFQPFDTLESCLKAGGRLPKGLSIHQAQHKSRGSNAYSRAEFGHGWADVDGDCQNSRHEALIAQSTAPVRYKSGKQCQVSAGRWLSPFTGAVIHNPRKIDIDHVVPLKWAWANGAYTWSKEKRERFANDPANLLSVEASLNRQKGAKGLDEWLPPANQCQYVLRFLRIAKTYQLTTPNHYKQIRKQVCS